MHVKKQVTFIHEWYSWWNFILKISTFSKKKTRFIFSGRDCSNQNKRLEFEFETWRKEFEAWLLWNHTKRISPEEDFLPLGKILRICMNRYHETPKETYFSSPCNFYDMWHVNQIFEILKKLLDASKAMLIHCHVITNYENYVNAENQLNRFNIYFKNNIQKFYIV